MKTLPLLLLFVSVTTASFGMMPQRSTPAVDLSGALTYPFISERGGRAFLQLAVTTADVGIRSDRKPVNLAVVLDRSGSMGDERKMEYARQAFAALTAQLRPDDILSVVVYDDVIDILRPARMVGEDRRSITGLIREIAPRGSTNLGGGLAEGLRQAECYAGHRYINRVVLLSDGLANVGVTDPYQLNAMARRYRGRSISVTTMGVGLEYNENLMMGLAESGGGNYYFIEHPDGLASIMRRELNMISSVLAQNASVSLHLGRGVRAVDVIGCRFDNDGSSLVIPLGDLYAADRREITVELSIPEGTGSLVVATGSLLYHSDILSGDKPSFTAIVRYTRDNAEIERHHDLETQAKADIAVSSRKVEQAMEAMDHGDHRAAEQRLDEAASVLHSSPAAAMSGAGGNAVRDQIGKTESYRRLMNDSTDLRKAKKSIQYENYKTQKRR